VDLLFFSRFAALKGPCLRFYGMLNFLRLLVLFSDVVTVDANTVSW